MKAPRRFFILALAVVFCAVTWSRAQSAFKPNEKSFYEQLPLLAEVLTYVKDRYVEDIKAKDLIYGSLRGICTSLDPHSEFLTPEQFEELQIETKGEFGGIGIVITVRDRILTVVSPLEDSPAERAGIRPKDRIVEIEGVSTKDITITEAVEKMRGRPGTKVKLTVLREGEEKLLRFEVERSMIQLKSVKMAKLLEKDIGYIRIIEFTDRTQKDLERAMRQLVREGAKAWIWDLRNNPGGLLEAAVEVAKLVLSKNSLIVYTKGRTPQDELSFFATYSKPYVEEPLIVLVNEGSASGSEIIAGAVKDNDRGVVVGTKTFGKGSVQTVLPLQDGSALRLTTSLYYTAKGNVIHMKGIMPDVVVEMPEVKEEEEEKAEEKKKEQPDPSKSAKSAEPSKTEKKKLSEGPNIERDPQLRKAVEVVRELQKSGKKTLVPLEPKAESVPAT